MAKSADAFRTISEVADWLETPAHVLRFWESKFSQVKPVKRAGGRRYYRPTDMLLLGGIKKLLHVDGMTIKGVQKLLRENGVKHVAGHSQPLDDITGAVVEENAAPPAAQEPSTAPADIPNPPKADPIPEDDDAGVMAAEPSDKAEDAETVPVMPSFTHRAPPQEAEATTAAKETPAEPVPARPLVADVPDDPEDTLEAAVGILTKIAGLQRPVSDDMADRLGEVLDRLRQRSDPNSQSHEN